MTIITGTLPYFTYFTTTGKLRIICTSNRLRFFTGVLDYEETRNKREVIHDCNRTLN